MAGSFASQGAVIKLDFTRETFDLIQVKDFSEITRVLSTSLEGAQSKLIGTAASNDDSVSFWRLDLK